MTPRYEPPVGRPPVLEWVAPSELNVDEAYQRSLEAKTSQVLIRKIAAHWDWGLCQPVNVSRRTDGSLWIVDGQHRHAAAMLRGDIQHLPCVIQSFGDRKEEATAFVSLNQQRRALNAVDVFKANLTAGDDTARAVMQVITDAGLSIARHQNYVSWKPGELYCVPTIQAAYRKHGRTVVSAALCALSEAFAGQVLQLAGNLLEGLFLFYARELPKDGFDPDAFVERLALNTQSEWVRRSRIEMVNRDVARKEAMRSVLADAYFKAVRELA